MAEPEETPAAKPARPLNRWGLGSLSVIRILLLAATLLALNYLSAKFFTRADLSRQGEYTLSPATTGYLKDQALSQRTKPVKWIMAYRRSAPFYDRTRVLAEEYARLSNGKIELEIVDPLRSPDRTQQVTKAYGIELVRDLIILDARTDDSPPVTEDETGIRVLHPHVKLVVADDMVVSATDAKGQRRPTGFQGEDVLTARLVESIEGRPRRMIFLADKSRIDSGGGASPWKSLEGTLRFQNIEMTAVNLSGLAEIPADAEGVTLVAPKYDLTDEELAVLEAYWNRPRAAILMLLKPGETPPKLRAFLRGQGVTPRRDRVVATEENRTVSTVRAQFAYGVGFLSGLAGQSVVFEGASSSLEVREGAEDLQQKKINPIGLIQVREGFWGETKFGEGVEKFDEREDATAPLFLAAGVTRGAATDDRHAADTSRMIVISNTDFLDPDRQQAGNIDFLASSVNWLVGRESLAGIGPRSLGTYKLPILDAQVSFINRVNLFFLPGFLLLAGALVWSSRRA